MRYKITIEYDGTNYSGWQKQNNKPSIQSEIEKAIFMFSHENVEVAGSGRTDAGVHAIAQIAHFDLQKEIDPFRVVSAINHYLREQHNSIAIIGCEIVDENFHARFSAKMRKYKYVIHNNKYPTVLNLNRVWHIFFDLDIVKMQEAMTYLLCGKADFSSFRDSKCQAKSPMKTINSVSLTKNGSEIIFEISARSFLHHMVRNIVGTLVDVGLGKITPGGFKEIIEAKDRTKAGMTAPASGLYLVETKY